MRKKVISFMLILEMGVLLFTGCGNSANVKEKETAAQEQNSFHEETEKKPDTEQKTDTEQEADTEQGADTEQEADMNKEEHIAEEALETDAENVVDHEEAPAENKNTVPPDINPVEATLENPAKIGEWVEAGKRSAKDKNYHTIYFRLTGITAGDKAREIVDEYNSDNTATISDLEQDDLEYRVVTYEVYFPKDYPQADYGISNTSLIFNLCNLKDSGAIAGYIGLSTVWDISNEHDALHAGETFKEGRAVFAMVKESSEYLFKYGYKDENDAQAYVYITGQ